MSKLRPRHWLPARRATRKNKGFFSACLRTYRDDAKAQCRIGFQPVSGLTAQDRSESSPLSPNPGSPARVQTGWKPILHWLPARRATRKNKGFFSACLRTYRDDAKAQCSIGFQPVSGFTAQDRSESSPLSPNPGSPARVQTGWKPILHWLPARRATRKNKGFFSACLRTYRDDAKAQCSIGFQPVSGFTAQDRSESSPLSPNPGSPARVQTGWKPILHWLPARRATRKNKGFFSACLRTYRDDAKAQCSIGFQPVSGFTAQDRSESSPLSPNPGSPARVQTGWKPILHWLPARRATRKNKGFFSACLRTYRDDAKAQCRIGFQPVSGFTAQDRSESSPLSPNPGSLARVQTGWKPILHWLPARRATRKNWGFFSACLRTYRDDAKAQCRIGFQPVSGLTTQDRSESSPLSPNPGSPARVQTGWKPILHWLPARRATRKNKGFFSACLRTYRDDAKAQCSIGFQPVSGFTAQDRSESSPLSPNPGSPARVQTGWKPILHWLPARRATRKNKGFFSACLRTYRDDAKAQCSIGFQPVSGFTAQDRSESSPLSPNPGSPARVQTGWKPILHWLPARRATRKNKGFFSACLRTYRDDAKAQCRIGFQPVSGFTAQDRSESSPLSPNPGSLARVQTGWKPILHWLPARRATRKNWGFFSACLRTYRDDAKAQCRIGFQPVSGLKTQ